MSALMSQGLTDVVLKVIAYHINAGRSMQKFPCSILASLVKGSPVTLLGNSSYFPDQIFPDQIV